MMTSNEFYKVFVVKKKKFYLITVPYYQKHRNTVPVVKKIKDRILNNQDCRSN